MTLPFIPRSVPAGPQGHPHPNVPPHGRALMRTGVRTGYLSFSPAGHCLSTDAPHTWANSQATHPPAPENRSSPKKKKRNVWRGPEWEGTQTV